MSPFPAQRCRAEAQPGQLEREEPSRGLRKRAHVLPDMSLIPQAEKAAQAVVLETPRQAVALETPRQAAAAPQCLPAEKPAGEGQSGKQGDARETWALELEWASA
jgi:hypothetical protein